MAFFFWSTVLLLPPVNFTIKAINLAQVLLRWEPNTDQEQRNVQLGYHVKINAPQEEDVSVYSDGNPHLNFNFDCIFLIKEILTEKKENH